MRICAWGAIACLAAAPMAFAASSVEKIRNNKVVVMEESLAPGESEAAAEKLPSLMVYMTDGMVLNGTVRSSTEPRQVTKGEIAGFLAAAPAIRNMGSAPLHFVRIEFLTHGGDERWGKTGLAPSYLMLHESRYERTYLIKIPAGAYEPQHTHHDRVVVCLSGAELEHILPDGTKQPSTLKTGEVVWRLGATHVGHNLGHTDLWVVAVEPK
jgi:quercetin dioxygenase-like cupin family protein